LITEINKVSQLKTNITKLQQLYDMQLHTAEKVYKLLDKHLPRGYSKKIVAMALKEGIVVSDATVRQVKNLLLANIQILLFLTHLATETKTDAAAQKKKLEELTLNK
jgi:hypothetical protein